MEWEGPISVIRLGPLPRLIKLLIAETMTSQRHRTTVRKDEPQGTREKGNGSELKELKTQKTATSDAVRWCHP
jgi:hypothetical protein